MTDKSYSIILCEGAADLAFISLYLINKHGWMYDKSAKIIDVNKNAGEHAAWYRKNDVELLICAVGGCDKFNSFYNDYIKRIINTKQSLSKFVVIIDADRSEDEAAKKIQFDKVDFSPNQWKECVWSNETIMPKIKAEDNYQAIFNSYLRIIPVSSQGALESVLIEAYKSTDPEITENSINFVNSLGERERKKGELNKLRKELKAKLSVIVSLIAPDSTFSELTVKFSTIDLNDKSIETNFGFLKELSK